MIFTIKMNKEKHYTEFTSHFVAISNSVNGQQFERLHRKVGIIFNRKHIMMWCDFKKKQMLCWLNHSQASSFQCHSLCFCCCTLQNDSKWMSSFSGFNQFFGFSFNNVFAVSIAVKMLILMCFHPILHFDLFIRMVCYVVLANPFWLTHAWRSSFHSILFWHKSDFILSFLPFIRPSKLSASTCICSMIVILLILLLLPLLLLQPLFRIRLFFSCIHIFL